MAIYYKGTLINEINYVEVEVNAPIPTPITDYDLLCTYSITSTTAPTQIFNTDYLTQNITNMYIDDVLVDTVDEYAFTSIGTHTVKYKLTDNTVIPNNSLSNIDALLSVEMGDTILTVDYFAFNGCNNLKSVAFGISTTTINNEAFKDCTSLTEITIPNTISTIDTGVFKGCTSLLELELPNSITEISAWLCSGCTNLRSVVIGDSVTMIGNEAFKDCTSLETITINTHTAPYIQTDAFSNVASSGILYYPCNSDYSEMLTILSGWSGECIKEPILVNNQEKEITITENGTQTITYDEGYTGLETVTITTDIQGGTSGVDFSIIGYDTELSDDVNEQINADIAYSKTLYDAWNPSNTSARALYQDDKKLVYAPLIDTSNVTSMDSMFYYCSRLTTLPQLDTSNVTNMNNMFYNCSSLTTLPQLDTSNVTNMNNMFYYCYSLTTLPQLDTSNVTTLSYSFNSCISLTTVSELDTSKVTNMGFIFYNCQSLTTIEGISVKSMGVIGSNVLVGFSNNSSIRKFLIKDIGYNSSQTTFDNSRISNWGVNSDEVPDARQSLIDSLITYSYDRATAGYSTCTITLSSNTKALLTTSELAQITAKGYTVA